MSRFITDRDHISTSALKGVHIEHHGILGQKWGVRRFRNKDGSLTAAGKDRYSVMRKDVETAFDEAIINTDVLKRSFKDWQSAVDNYGYYKTETNPKYKDAYEKATRRDSELYESTRKQVIEHLKKQGKSYLKDIDLDELTTPYSRWALSKDGEQFEFAFGDAYGKKIIDPALSEYRKEHPDRR